LLEKLGCIDDIVFFLSEGDITKREETLEVECRIALDWMNRKTRELKEGKILWTFQENVGQTYQDNLKEMIEEMEQNCGKGK